MRFSLFAGLSSLALLTSPASANVWTDHFDITRIPTPQGVDPQIGGLATLPNGDLIATFHRGEVMIYSQEKKSWSTFAEGLHEPLGIVVEDENTVVVMQRPELTRIRDTDGDGTADSYETIYDGFGMSGNYHEFAFGPAVDAEGNYYIALNVASNGAGIRPEIRGEWSEIGQLKTQEEMQGGGNWGKRKNKAGRMYARVAYRGWVIKMKPDGSEVQPFAHGFRSPDGIGFDADGRLLITDNQGDWLATSKVHHVREGHFHGHPASLIWREDWDGKDPLKMSEKQLDEMRTPAAALLPQGELSNSPTQPIAVPEGIFGPFSQQTLIGEMNQPNLVRFLPDEGIEGATQGAAIPFMKGKALGIGSHRLAFDKDGVLYVGKTHLSWAGDEGIVRIQAKDSVGDAFAVDAVKLRKDGFVIEFTQPLDQASAEKLTAKEHTYHYFAEYGSPKVDEDELRIKDLQFSDDGKSVFVPVRKVREGFVYTFQLRDLRSTDGAKLLGDKVYYTVVKAAE